MGNVWSNAEPKLLLLLWKYTEGPNFQSHAQIQRKKLISCMIMAAHSAA